MQRANTKPVIMCLDLTKDYGEGPAKTAALRGGNLEVYPGELLMLAGPSGCGKTTLLCVIAGILDRSGGRCMVTVGSGRTLVAVTVNHTP